MLSVVIPSYYNAQCLELTLRSLTRQTLPADLYEVVVVYDGCPVPERLDELRHTVPFRLTELPLPARRGRSAARNAGIRAARGDRVLLLDNDSLCPPDLLARHHETGEKHPDAVVMGGRGELAAQGWAVLREVSDGGPLPTAPPGGHDVRAATIQDEPWLYGFSHNLSVGRAEALAVGLFDEDFGTRWGGEDLDFSYRLFRHLGRDAAKFHYEPSILCWHLPHYRDLERTYADHRESLAHLRDKHRHFEVELVSGLPEVLAGSLADIAARVADYRTVMDICRREKLCSAEPWRPVAERLLGDGSRALCVGYDTAPLAGPNGMTFDYGRPVTDTNLHLLGVDVPFAEGTFDAVLSTDFWRLLRLPDLLPFIAESLTVAGTLLLAASDELTDRGPALGFDPLTDLDYFTDLLAPAFRVTREAVPGTGTVLTVVPAGRERRPGRARRGTPAA
ncbi:MULTISPECIES: glycosyltransferase family 2 protein [Streptomyces]|uniref:Glycosyltransferase n=1 Tax=Streptomyces lycii TaxID=2654337 RepID=A0ABQ7FLF2_9ACTN|nr:glycosyltransferase [Streptomyces lycii]KAF4409510.1 glycosyltransferase [Streptomyces lycii]